MSIGRVQMPLSAFQAKPTVTWGHIDGPMLYWAGRVHWLTWRERLALWIGLTDIEHIAQKHWPQRRDFYLVGKFTEPST